MEVTPILVQAPPWDHLYLPCGFTTEIFLLICMQYLHLSLGMFAIWGYIQYLIHKIVRELNEIMHVNYLEKYPVHVGTK